MWASMRPGMTVLPFTSSTSASFGTATRPWLRRPNLLPVMTMTASSMGTPPFPSISRAPVTARTLGLAAAAGD